jgi:hypothetical protein
MIHKLGPATAHVKFSSVIPLGKVTLDGQEIAANNTSVRSKAALELRELLSHGGVGRFADDRLYTFLKMQISTVLSEADQDFRDNPKLHVVFDHDTDEPTLITGADAEALYQLRQVANQSISRSMVRPNANSSMMPRPDSFQIQKNSEAEKNTGKPSPRFWLNPDIHAL